MSVDLLRVIFGALLVASTTVVITGTASACVCVAGTDSGSFATSDVVFVGTAVKGSPSPYPSEQVDPWTIRVESVQKGPRPAEFVVHTGSKAIATLHGGKKGIAVSSCGFTLDPGRRYQIFAKADKKGQLTTGLCSGSRELAPVAGSADLNRGQRPQPYWPETDSTAAFIVTGGATLALAGAILLQRRIP